MGAVLRWLKEVHEWFSLGIHLNILPHELKTIEQNHPSNNKHCKEEMVLTWIRLGGASWSTLVGALWEIGRQGLAKKLASKFGERLTICVFDHYYYDLAEIALPSSTDFAQV